jgi:hypothetical protein
MVRTLMLGFAVLLVPLIFRLIFPMGIRWTSLLQGYAVEILVGVALFFILDVGFGPGR